MLNRKIYFFLGISICLVIFFLYFDRSNEGVLEKDIETVEGSVSSGTSSHSKDTFPENNFHKDEEMQQELDKLIEMIDRHPKSAKLYAERSTIFMVMNKPVQALSDIEAAVELEPGNAQYLTNRAMAYRKFERMDDAMNDLNNALRINSELLAAYFNRGVLYFGMENFEKSMEDFTTCIEKAPNTEQPLFNRAFSYEQLGKLDLAKKDLAEFIKISVNEDAIKMAKSKLEEWSKIDYKTIIKSSENKGISNPHIQK